MDELARAEDRAVDVRLRREVDDRLAACRGRRDGVGVGDVTVVELVRDALEVGPVARVGQPVEDDDLVASHRQPPHEVRADEPRSAGDENAHCHSLVPNPAEAIRGTLVPSSHVRGTVPVTSL